MNIQSRIKQYTVRFGKNLLAKAADLLKEIPHNRLFFFIDKNVYDIYHRDLAALIDKNFYYVIDAKEENKEFLKLAEYYSLLLDEGFTKKDILVTIGGGILQDISGFIASTYLRGIKWVFFPTTLLAQADSCIGSKTSINFKKRKNLLGSFFPPDNIFIDSRFCSTLLKGDFNSGRGEIIKFHLMSDKKNYRKLLAYLKLHDPLEPGKLNGIIRSTLKIKMSYFMEDEFDSGRRNLLNYGHCFGHAVESASHFVVPHGEAVILGMGFANLVSLKRGLMDTQTYETLENLLKPYYPTFDLSSIESEKIVYYMKSDKKRTGRHLTMILCLGIGKQIKCDDIKENEIHSAYREFLSIIQK
jgi:3-dehydroquinate synthase